MNKHTTMLPHTIVHVDPRDPDRVLDVVSTVQYLPPTADRLTTMHELEPLNRIAVVRKSGLGDCLMLQPALAEVKRRLPHLEIDLHVPGKWVEVFLGMPHLHLTRDVGALDQVAYDKVIDCSLFPERNPHHLEIDRGRLFGRAFGVELSDTRYEVVLTEEEVERGREFVSQFSPPVVCVCPTSARVQSNWPHAAEFSRRFRQTWGGTMIHVTDRDRHDYWASATTPPSLRQVAAVLKASNLLVTTDTGIMHLAFGAGSRAVAAMFGVSVPELRIPDWTGYYAHVPDDLPCCPCDMGQQSFTCGIECMEKATAQSIINGLRPLMEVLSV